MIHASQRAEIEALAKRVAQRAMNSVTAWRDGTARIAIEKLMEAVDALAHDEFERGVRAAGPLARQPTPISVEQREIFPARYGNTDDLYDFGGWGVWPASEAPPR